MGDALNLGDGDDRLRAGLARYGGHRAGGEGSSGGIEKHLEQRVVHFLVR